jgi:hypothetical protein
VFRDKYRTSVTGQRLGNRRKYGHRPHGNDERIRAATSEISCQRKWKLPGTSAVQIDNGKGCPRLTKQLSLCLHKHEFHHKAPSGKLACKFKTHTFYAAATKIRKQDGKHRIRQRETFD